MNGRLPPVAHLRKMQRRVELLDEVSEDVLAPWRDKQAGKRRLFVERFDLVMRDVRRMVEEAVEAKRNPADLYDKAVAADPDDPRYKEESLADTEAIMHEEGPPL